MPDEGNSGEWVDQEADAMTLTIPTATDHLLAAKELLDALAGKDLKWHDDDAKAALEQIAERISDAQEAMGWNWDGYSLR